MYQEWSASRTFRASETEYRGDNIPPDHTFELRLLLKGESTTQLHPYGDRKEPETLFEPHETILLLDGHPVEMLNLVLMFGQEFITGLLEQLDAEALPIEE